MQQSYKRCLFQNALVLLLICTSTSVFSQSKILLEKIPSQIDINQIQTKQFPKERANSKEAGKDRNSDIANSAYKASDSLVNENNTNNINTFEMTYGQNVFSNAAVTDLSDLSTPPIDYPIGVGDHVIVSLWDGAELQENYLVGKDGSIFPKGLGKINVQGLPFETMRSMLTAKFKAVVPSSTKISIALGQPKTININVVGNVSNPGPMTVSAFSNAFNVIAKAGGVTEYGNLREIQIKRAGILIDELDVYKYLTTGDFGKHIYLQNNDFVIVPFMKKKVFATGQFKRPMYYQLKEDEGIKALLFYSGGVKADALSSTIKVSRIENEKEVIKDFSIKSINASTNKDFILNDGDIVQIAVIKSGLVNKVEVKGEVKYPGVYEFKAGDKLFDLIERVGGVGKNTYLNKAYIFRGAGDSTNYSPQRMEVNLLHFDNQEDPSNLELKPYDIIQLFSKSEFNQQEYVEIFGEVRNPGKLKKYEFMTLQDLLYLSGGLKPTAEYGRLEVSSIVDLDLAQKGLTPTKTVVKLYNISSDLSIDSNAAKVILKPYDQVYVRKNPTFELQQNIEIKGLVKYPGKYTRLDKYERISSYLERAGGVTENADLSGALLLRRVKRNVQDLEVMPNKMKLDSNGRFYRDSLPIEMRFTDEPICIDLEKAVKEKNSKYDIILQENDVVVIPEINPFVSVVGNVQSPLKISFDRGRNNLSYYIDKAGGFAEKPWRRRVYVTYANGRSKQTKNFLFLHFYPKIKEGAVIVIPRRPKGQEKSELIKSVIISAIPVVLTSIIFKYIK